jgi:hypothetical protein
MASYSLHANFCIYLKELLRSMEFQAQLRAL